MKKILLAFSICSASFAHGQIANHVVISEIYGGGGNSGSTYTNDFVELYNPTASPVSLAGWSVQYASAGGNFNSGNQIIALSDTIQAKGYYLIQAAAQGGGTTPLPTPDATGPTLMSATAGKIALVNTTTALGTSCTGAQVIDLVAYGSGTSCAEGSAAPAPSNATSIERKASTGSTAVTLGAGGSEQTSGNGYDANNNSTDFVVPLSVNPQNSLSPLESPTPIGNSVLVAAGNAPAEPATNGNFTISLTTVAPVGGVTVTYLLSGTATGGTDYSDFQSGTITIAEGASSGTVTITTIDDAIAEASETIILTLQSANAGYTVSSTTATIAISDNEISATPIHAIQGTGTTATSGSYTSEAVVTGVYPLLSPGGFYMQEEDADADANLNTSEGIFVVSSANVAVGNRVRVTGTVQENSATPSFSQAVFSAATVTVLDNNVSLPTITDVTLPVTAISDFERYEGMLVRFPSTLTVTNNYTLGRFGEVGLSAGGVVYQPTQVIDPNDVTPSGTNTIGGSNAAAINALTTANALRTILLDDGTNNTTILPYADPTDRTLRIGSTVDNLTGIMGYAFSTYRIQPIPAAAPVFSYADRPSLPSVGASNLKVAGFNMLNYFNGNGLGGGFPTERGADSQPEFTRQRDKLISSISQINADVVGLIELENDGTGANSAIQDIVNGLNNVLGTGTYSIIDDGATIQSFTAGNGDVIRCGIIYKSAVVTPVGAAMVSPKVGLSDTFNRPPVAQTFRTLLSNTTFNFVVNHFKSKGCTSASGGDLDQNDGQACYNERRKAQAIGLLSFFNNTVIPTSGTDRIVSVGDYNAYFEEDPMDVFRAANYTVLGSSATYSYQFDGQLGSLDHAVVSSSLLGSVTGMAEWNVNAAEPVYLDYNDLTDDGGDDFSNPFASTYTVAPFRSSDHDPVLIGLNFSAPLPVDISYFSARKNIDKVDIKWTTTREVNFSNFIVERSTEGTEWTQIANLGSKGEHGIEANYVVVDDMPSTGQNLYRLKAVDLNGSFNYSNVQKVNFSAFTDVQLYPNPVGDILNVGVNDEGVKSCSLTVYNVVNQQMMQCAFYAVKGKVQLDLSMLAPGVYFLKMTTDQGSSIIKRFVKQ